MPSRGRLFKRILLRAVIIEEFDDGGVMVEFVAPFDGETVCLTPGLLEHSEVKMPEFPPEIEVEGGGPAGF